MRFSNGVERFSILDKNYEMPYAPKITNEEKRALRVVIKGLSNEGLLLITGLSSKYPKKANVTGGEGKGLGEAKSTVESLKGTFHITSQEGITIAEILFPKVFLQGNAAMTSISPARRENDQNLPIVDFKNDAVFSSVSNGKIFLMHYNHLPYTGVKSFNVAKSPLPPPWNHPRPTYELIIGDKRFTLTRKFLKRSLMVLTRGRELFGQYQLRFLIVYLRIGVKIQRGSEWAGRNRKMGQC